MDDKKYRIELTEHQLLLMAQCVEDCHRFMAGQMELSNSTACLKHTHDLWDKLNELQPLVTPELGCGAAYCWNGGLVLMTISENSSLKPIISTVRYITK